MTPEEWARVLLAGANKATALYTQNVTDPALVMREVLVTMADEARNASEYQDRREAAGEEQT